MRFISERLHQRGLLLSTNSHHLVMTSRRSSNKSLRSYERLTALPLTCAKHSSATSNGTLFSDAHVLPTDLTP